MSEDDPREMQDKIEAANIRLEKAVRDGIARILFDRDQITLERRGYFKMRWEECDAKYLSPWREEAQAIVDAFGLEMRRDNLNDDGYRIFGKFIED